MSSHRSWLKQEAARWAAHGGINPDGPEHSLRKTRSGWSASTGRTFQSEGLLWHHYLHHNKHQLYHHM